MTNLMHSSTDERKHPDDEEVKRTAWSLVVLVMTIEEIERGLRKLKEKRNRHSSMSDGGRKR